MCAWVKVETDRGLGKWVSYVVCPHCDRLPCPKCRAAVVNPFTKLCQAEGCYAALWNSRTGEQQ